ncbi:MULTISPECIES: S41 family peptidase [Kordiimonas]|jgi:hypothetical protein|uniref:S41 family peptidase n=1 Tax=Kordiimonas TaxID=288021 RepID=UPI002580765C|nr:S41 family peptidase [Kordiimonas sp. UBA4487]
MSYDSKALVAIAMLAASILGTATQAKDTSTFTPEEVRQDIDEIVERVLSVHPQPTHSFEPAALKAAADALQAKATSPMSEREAWKLIAQLNPVFRDAHAAIYYPDLKDRIADDLAAGGHMLPLTVSLSAENKLHLTGSRTAGIGTDGAPVILSINGKTSSDIVAAMMARAQGDSETFRRAYVGHRFSDLHWELYGGSDTYDIRLQLGHEVKTVTIPGTTGAMRPQTVPLEEKVERRILPGDIGYLRVDAFAYPPEQEAAFFGFMKETWQAFHDAGVRDVIIDVRKNGGGTDHYWQMGIAPYVTDTPFPFLSYFKVRLTERNLKLGPIQGPQDSIQEGPFAMVVPIKPEEPLRISGKAYILAGPYSYSSTILFLTAMQDAANAVIAGQPTGGRSCTTGRIEFSKTKHTRIELSVPTLIFTRPAGPEACMDPVQPDIPLPPAPGDSNAQIEALAAHIRQQSK